MQSNNKGRLELRGAREPTNGHTDRPHYVNTVHLKQQPSSSISAGDALINTRNVKNYPLIFFLL